jgi:hypothetical protein
MPPLDDEWYVSVDGVQEGPFSLERAREWVASRGPEDDVYCWRDTFDDWLPISDVAEFQGARRASKLALRPPPSTPSLSKIGQARVIDRAASTPDADLFGSEDEAMTRVDPRLFNGEPVLPVPRPPPSDTDEGPVMRLIVDDDAAADEAPAPDTGPMPSAPGPLGVPAIAGPAAGAAPVAQPPAARAWLSDPLSGPQPALRLPSPYPGSPAISDGRLSPLAMTPGRGPLSEPMPVRRRSRALLVVVLLLALIGSGAGAYLLVRTYVRPGSGQSALSPEDVSTELQRPSNQAALKQCYDLARQNSPALAIDRIDVDLTVDPAGRVAHVSLSQHADTPFGTCLIDSIHSWTFRASDKGVTARVPLIFGR